MMEEESSTRKKAKNRSQQKRNCYIPVQKLHAIAWLSSLNFSMKQVAQKKCAYSEKEQKIRSFEKKTQPRSKSLRGGSSFGRHEGYYPSRERLKR